MEELRDWGIRCLLVRILLLWLHTPIVTTYSHRQNGRNSSSAAFDGKCHRRSTRYVPSIPPSGRQEGELENKKDRVEPFEPSPACLHALLQIFDDFRLAENEIGDKGTLDPPRLACLHACHARAVIDSRGGLRSNVLEGPPKWLPPSTPPALYTRSVRSADEV